MPVPGVEAAEDDRTQDHCERIQNHTDYPGTLTGQGPFVHSKPKSERVTRGTSQLFHETNRRLSDIVIPRLAMCHM